MQTPESPTPIQIPDSIREMFDDPEGDMKIGREAFDLFLSAKDPDRLALLYLGPLMMIANRVIVSSQESWEKVSPVEHQVVIDKLVDIGLGEFVPALLSDALKANDASLQDLYESSLYEQNVLLLLIHMNICNRINIQPASLITDSLAKRASELMAGENDQEDQ